jgi:hypothetical protein
VDGGEAFRVERVKDIAGGLITVSGRAYRELHIGDVLEDGAPRATEGAQRAEFAIVGISTYGRTVQSLGRMLTGVLVLRGRDGGTPQADMLLMKDGR